MESGVATRPIADFEAYREQLQRFVFRSGFVMKPVFERRARRAAEARHLCRGRGRARAARGAGRGRRQAGVPILIGRPAVIETR
jgi:malate dehydrogenase (oxaloacetate-decarboxylating)(NADP+)